MTLEYTDCGSDTDLGIPMHFGSAPGAVFRTPTRYILADTIGQGAYGVVCSATDSQAKDSVAIKKIENVFDHLSFAKRTLRELRILRNLQHENIVSIRDVFITSSKLQYDDVYVVNDLLETDLTAILKSSQDITDEHVQFFLYQVLRGVKYLHSARIIHRDLKPRNLLVNSNCDLKICDFGLARVNYLDKEFELSTLTEYVCTRWYRAPEVLCSQEYTQKVDIWSIGCIFAEMLGRRALLPGHNTQHQLQLIVACLGSPSDDDIAYIVNAKQKKFVKELAASEVPGKSFDVLFPNATASSLSLLKWMLQFSAHNRPTVCEALDNAYMERLHCPEDEPSRSLLPPADFEFERRKMSVETLREEIFLEILRYHPKMRDEYLAKDGAYCVEDIRLLEPGESAYDCETDFTEGHFSN